MASLSQAKTLGGIGGILVFFPGLSLVGWILILLATKEISDSVQDNTIFDDAVLAAITAIIGAIVFVFSFLAFLFFPRTPGGVFGFPFMLALGIPFLVALGVFWIFAIVSAVFLKRSYEKISQRLNIGAFASAGSLYLVGAVLTIVLIGFLILLIALIFQVVAYFSIQDRLPTPTWGQPGPQTFSQPPPPTQSSTVSPPPQAMTETKFCQNCGSRIPRTAVFCTSCGAKQS